MIEPVLSAVEKARAFLRLRERLGGNRRAVHRAMSVDNNERGSAQDYRDFDGDDLSALMMDFAALERELAEAQAQVSRGQDAVNTLNGRLAAERIENTRLREAFVTMEKAYNANEAAIAALRERHEEAVEQAWREAALMVIDCPFTSEDIDKAWLESSAKAVLEGKP